MLTLDFQNMKIPLTCITGLSYSLQGNIVDYNNLSCRCLGINPVSVQVQITLSQATCIDTNAFQNLARELSQTKPSKNSTPSMITIGGQVILPQLQFMLSSTNLTYSSDRNGRLQEMDISWTLMGSRVIKDENRNIELRTNNSVIMPKVTLHCLGKTLECAQDISICELRLSGFGGRIDLLLADTYKDILRESWLVDVVSAEDSYFEIENYGKFYIFKGNMDSDVNWIGFDLTKFDKSWYKNQTKTFISNDNKLFGLKDVFPCATVKSKARFSYLKYDDSPINILYKMQDSLGYLIGLKGDNIYLYDPPIEIPSGQVTYDFLVDNDTMTAPITKVIMRDGVNEFVAGDDSGESFFVKTECRVEESSAKNVLNYAKFNQNMITITIPLDKRIAIGSIININNGQKIINCVVTEYDIDFLNNSITLELHYVNR